MPKHRTRSIADIMNVAPLQTEFTEFAQSLFQEGYLDGQFTFLQTLDDNNVGRFTTDVVTLYIVESPKKIHGLAYELATRSVDFDQVNLHAQNLKGSSCSIGFRRVKDACVSLLEYCDQKNADGCRRCLHHLKSEFTITKDKVETLFKIRERILAAGGSIPTIY